ncbi:Panacea domain-containing protein [uncultured Tateyamaria sp.]|uniref:Panacea domain-containing protein n=1 Tax=uncultured Tateyamaria sp. TaxID=455651 RepID=UPI0026115C48|nr:type II toxin-antitoxin system antitoxin SocA domain-containing protein [uncultured Tateyamaria sp.]
MAYDARQIANWFVERSGKDGRQLSIMSLLKLTYVAHGWHLEMRKAPLFYNEVQAWQYGPVIPDVYHGFRQQGVNVTRPIAGIDSLFSEQDEALLEEIWGIYGGMSPFQLSDITHEENGPWHIATSVGGNYARIPNELIQKHYEMKRMEHQKSVHAG